MAEQFVNLTPRGQFPNKDNLVATCGCRQLPVGRDSDGPDVFLVTVEAVGASGGIPSMISSNNRDATVLA